MIDVKNVPIIIYNDGTIVINVSKDFFDNVNRVIVNEEDSKFSKIFYQEESDE